MATLGGLPGVTGLIIANGGDNVAACAPFFASGGSGGVAVTIAVFAIGVTAPGLQPPPVITGTRVYGRLMSVRDL